MDVAKNRELIDSVIAMQNGDADAFNTFYLHTNSYVYKRAKFIMKDEDDALDLTQETFVQAYKNIKSLEQPENVYAWLGAIYYRQGMRIFRSRKEILVDEEAEGIFEDIVSEDIDTSPEKSNEIKETSDIVMSLIEELPPLQKAAVVAFYYDNKKIDDIAMEFECSPNTIKSRLNYAKKFLKEKVEVHEKTHGYRLHSVTPFVMAYALKKLFAQSGYTLAADVSAKVCGTIVSTATMATTAGARTTAAASATTAAASTTTAASATTTGVATVSVGAKIAIGVVAATLGIGVTLGIINSGEDVTEPTTVQETTVEKTTVVQETTSEKPTPAPDIPSITNYNMDWNYAEGVYRMYSNTSDAHVLTVSNVYMVDDSTISIDIDYNGLGVQTVQGRYKDFSQGEVSYVDSQGNTYNLIVEFFCAMKDNTFFLLGLRGTITDLDGNVTNMLDNPNARYFLSKNGEVFE